LVFAVLVICEPIINFETLSVSLDGILFAFACVLILSNSGSYAFLRFLPIKKLSVPVVMKTWNFVCTTYNSFQPNLGSFVKGGKR
jgi:hypothetical protein